MKFYAATCVINHIFTQRNTQCIFHSDIFVERSNMKKKGCDPEKVRKRAKSVHTCVPSHDFFDLFNRHI